MVLLMGFVDSLLKDNREMVRINININRHTASFSQKDKNLRRKFKRPSHQK